MKRQPEGFFLPRRREACCKCALLSSVISDMSARVSSGSTAPPPHPSAYVSIT